MKINLNQEFVVMLARRGVLAYNKHYTDVGMEPPKKVKTCDKLRLPLWEIMSIFGEYSYMGPEPPISTEIEMYGDNIIDGENHKT